MQAALMGCDALWASAPRARMVHTDPIIHVAADECEGLAHAHVCHAHALRQSQFEAWDMLCGRLEPGLGGAPRYLDIVGANYYHDNQWLHPSGKRLHWQLDTARRRGLDELLTELWQRYERPLFLAETGHVGAGRAGWIDAVGRAVQRVLAQGIPLQAVCLYPLLDRPDWEDPTRWHHSGLWDVHWEPARVHHRARRIPTSAGARGRTNSNMHLTRLLHAPAARQLKRWQRILPTSDDLAQRKAGARSAHTCSAPNPDHLDFSTSLLPQESSMSAASTLIVFSHLRWDFVYQRPQQLLSRMARRMPVLFIEEPIGGAAAAGLEVMEPELGVHVLRPHVTSHGAGFHLAHTEQVQALLQGYLRDNAVDNYWLWFYTPMALPLARTLEPQGVIYDCMDELSAFRFAPSELLTLETELMARADLVFTGGHSLYEAKCARHPHVHCFPSSVDAAHFRRALHPLHSDHAAQASIGHPRLGFFGVIDERLDLDLVATIADAHPEWSLIMVGPVVKIDPSTLPQRPNIHWLGQRDYAELPQLIGGWDVCLMPFALNESTRFISPTKTLEYLAGGGCVVSTPIRDVVAAYTGIVAIADTPAAFVAACEDALRRTADERARHAEAVKQVLARTSWDCTVEAMLALLDETPTRRLPFADFAPAHPASGAGGSKSGLHRGMRATAGDTETELAAITGRVRPVNGSDDEFDYLIVGGGFAGSVLAERLASQLNLRVLIIDRRDHIGGNAYDCLDDAGVLIHRYGPHIFHTNAPRVLAYLSQFTQWRPYEHRVLAQVDDQQLPMPINLTTLNKLYGLNLDEAGAERFLAARATELPSITSSRDVVVSKIGEELYQKFFEGYTRKQWGRDASQLDKMVTARVPTRTTADDRYFQDIYQCMPLHGYTKMFERMIDHPNIAFWPNTEFAKVKHSVRYKHLIYCGPVDEYFGYCFGKLPYRSLRFDHQTVEQAQFQSVAVVNYPAPEVSYTRITEYKHLTGQVHPRTSISYEYPTEYGDPYYPVPAPENAALYRRYKELADNTLDVTFTGRLGTYRYYNMDQVVAQSLTLFGRLAEKHTVETLGVA